MLLEGIHRVDENTVTDSQQPKLHNQFQVPTSLLPSDVFVSYECCSFYLQTSILVARIEQVTTKLVFLIYLLALLFVYDNSQYATKLYFGFVLS